MLEAAELEACAAAAIHDREPGEDFPHGQVWLVQTISGSVYRVRRAAGDRWWLAADNVPNPHSRPLADGEWEIVAPVPWPPVVGARLLMEAPPHFELGDPRRCPGGGKITSAVQSVAHVGVTASPGGVAGRPPCFALENP